MSNRRDARGRSEAFARVVAWVRQQRRLVTSPPEEIGNEAVAQRVLRQLAIRGFVRRRGNAWEPTPLLFCPAELIPET